MVGVEADFDTNDMLRLEREIDELEQNDPAVRRASIRYDQTVSDILERCTGIAALKQHLIHVG